MNVSNREMPTYSSWIATYFTVSPSSTDDYDDDIPTTGQVLLPFDMVAYPLQKFGYQSMLAARQKLSRKWTRTAVEAVEYGICPTWICSLFLLHQRIKQTTHHLKESRVLKYISNSNSG